MNPMAALKLKREYQGAKQKEDGERAKARRAGQKKNPPGEKRKKGGDGHCGATLGGACMGEP